MISREMNAPVSCPDCKSQNATGGLTWLDGEPFMVWDCDDCGQPYVELDGDDPGDTRLRERRRRGRRRGERGIRRLRFRG